MKNILFIFLIIISSCDTNVKSNKSKNINDTEKLIELDKSDYAILTIEPKNNWKFKNAELSELNQTELIEIEKLLEDAVAKNNEIQFQNLKNHNEKYPDNQLEETGFELNLDNFQRQYWPVINENGKKVVWINFFCSREEPISTDNILVVMDGGNCYFNIKINLTDKMYLELSINGYA